MDELKWYLYDILKEVMTQHGILEDSWCLEESREDAVCLISSENGFLLRADGKDTEYEDFYHACRALLMKLFPNEEKAEEAMSEFLTATMDLPKRMENPSLTGLENRIAECRRSMASLEENAAKSGEQKYGKKLALDRIYLNGMLKQLHKLKEK